MSQTEKDDAPSKSRIQFVWVNMATGEWILECRTENRGSGDIRLGELKLRGSVHGKLTARIE